MQTGLIQNFTKGFEDKTLFIIGNGFDLYHKLPTSFMHFYYYLKSKGEDDFIRNIEHIFHNLHYDSELWRSFEQALEEVDIPLLFEESTENLDINWDNNVITQPQKALNNTIPLIKSYLRKWIETIEMKAKPLLPLPNDSFYLSFNYTTTLEDTYQISHQQICHIHGCKDQSADFIVGCNKYYNKSELEHQQLSFYEEEGKKGMYDVLNSVYKDTYKQTLLHQDFFTTLYKIERIVVLGHSLSPIDWSYFTEVKRLVGEKCKWMFSVHNEEDRYIVLPDFINRMEIMDVEYISL